MVENHFCHDWLVKLLYFQEHLQEKKNSFCLGKFTISAGNTIMPTYTAELYPTSIRNIGVGACNVAAGMALILTPALSELV